jgi:hypothetical protein
MIFDRANLRLVMNDECFNSQTCHAKGVISHLNSSIFAT